jgi:histidinol phosphatase-like PHP family hydrolase
VVLEGCRGLDIPVERRYPVHKKSRREFLGGATAALLSVPGVLANPSNPGPASAGLEFPIVDYHVHLNATFRLENALALSQQQGFKFGILEHAGTRENIYPAILTNDTELGKWIDKLDGKPVYKGVQAEWTDWMKCFSRQMVARLDYVLSDALTIPDRNGNRTKMWSASFDPGDPNEFMDRYVKWNVEVIEKEPLDILAHPTWLPAALEKDYDALWTAERIKPIIAALKRTGTAVEIDSAFNLPRMPFLRQAKDAKLKFSFGSNSGTGPARGMDFCIGTAKALGLTRRDMFVPARNGRKPFEARKLII